jgi:hypothetical protein
LPNPKEKKKRKGLLEERNEDEKSEEMTKKDGQDALTAPMNLGGKFEGAVEEPEAVQLEGGPHIWNNLISGVKPAWTNISNDIKWQYQPFKLFAELFGEPGMPTIHNLVMKGKNIRDLGTGAHLTPAGWKWLFQEVFETEMPLAKSIRGKTMRQFGICLALTDPETVFLEKDRV